MYIYIYIHKYIYIYIVYNTPNSFVSSHYCDYYYYYKIRVIRALVFRMESTIPRKTPRPPCSSIWNTGTWNELHHQRQFPQGTWTTTTTTTTTTTLNSIATATTRNTTSVTTTMAGTAEMDKGQTPMGFIVRRQEGAGYVQTAFGTRDEYFNWVNKLKRWGA